MIFRINIVVIFRINIVVIFHINIVVIFRINIAVSDGDISVPTTAQGSWTTGKVGTVSIFSRAGRGEGGRWRLPHRAWGCKRGCKGVGAWSCSMWVRCGILPMKVSQGCMMG